MALLYSTKILFCTTKWSFEPDSNKPVKIEKAIFKTEISSTCSSSTTDKESRPPCETKGVTTTTRQTETSSIRKGCIDNKDLAISYKEVRRTNQNHQANSMSWQLVTIERAWDDFRQTQDSLEELNAECEDDGERETFESEYYAAAAAAKALIARHSRTRSAVLENCGADNHDNGNASNSVDWIKLPPINLPTFDGSYDQWPNFRDTFKAIIDENTNLSDIKKLYYLRLAFKGVAAEILGSMELSAGNYDVAWNILENRFENKRVLVHHHVQALVEFSLLQKESRTGLRQLLDHTEKHVRALRKLSQPTDQWGTILVHLMTVKFDNAIKPAVTSEVKPEKCLTCKEGKHRVYHCPTFLNLAPQDRIKEIKRLKVCLNCFKVGHSIKACKFGTCRICHKKHNTLLHIPRSEDTDFESNNQRATTVEQKPPTEQTTSVAHLAVPIADRGLLATAIIKIQDNDGEFQECRAFLDLGSQSNFMTRDLCERLGLPQRRKYLAIRGVDNTQTAAFTDTRATIQFKFNAFKVKLKFSVLPRITTNLPLSEIDKGHLQIPDSITFADPLFYKPGIAQKTKLGWIIAGPLSLQNPREPSTASVCFFSNSDNIETQLERFWQVEEGSLHANLSETEQICEDEFMKGHRRNAGGRFEVRLPLRDKVERLGQSREIAIKRLKELERKFVSSSELKVQYTNFMQEYQELGHMSEVINQGANGTINYLPHHGIWKDDSLATKIRIVFDALCPTTSGVSLNNILHVGPTIQQDLFSIILRFCQHQFVITANIKQMYRQILLQDDQRDLQRIVWRPNTNEQIQKYRLNIVTYGLASASFLAIRCLHQLANENQENYPRTSDVIRNDFYVDDLISGGNHPDSLIRLKTELTKIFQSAGFALHK
ncbi:uncharacterized protein LOC105206576 [Solenopsis invicta]|uniref:uncharacterized protein LOC105206576 n=1 Tax=Solenopsis invicta TaxID=13686 RepID=UPI00193CFE75|nr:uncharacterized protein LOC105206576 [Solenopsis invicta]